MGYYNTGMQEVIKGGNISIKERDLEAEVRSRLKTRCSEE